MPTVTRSKTPIAASTGESKVLVGETRSSLAAPNNEKNAVHEPGNEPRQKQPSPNGISRTFPPRKSRRSAETLRLQIVACLIVWREPPRRHPTFGAITLRFAVRTASGLREIQEEPDRWSPTDIRFRRTDDFARVCKIHFPEWSGRCCTEEGDLRRRFKRSQVAHDWTSSESEQIYSVTNAPATNAATRSSEVNSPSPFQSPSDHVELFTNRSSYSPTMKTATRSSELKTKS